MPKSPLKLFKCINSAPPPIFDHYFLGFTITVWNKTIKLRSVCILINLPFSQSATPRPTSATLPRRPWREGGRPGLSWQRSVELDKEGHLSCLRRKGQQFLDDWWLGDCVRYMWGHSTIQLMIPASATVF